MFLKNVLWVTFFSFGSSNNFLVGCWASLSSPLPGITLEINRSRGWCSMLTTYTTSVCHKYLHIYPYWGFFSLELSKLWLVCSFLPPSPFSSSFFLATCYLLLLYLFIFISWRLISLQYCSGFCHTLTWISHGFTQIGMGNICKTCYLLLEL